MLLFFILLSIGGLGWRLQLDGPMLQISSTTDWLSVLIVLEMTILSTWWLSNVRGRTLAQTNSGMANASSTPTRTYCGETTIVKIGSSLSQSEVLDASRTKRDPPLHTVPSSTTPGPPVSVLLLNRVSNQQIRSQSRVSDRFRLTTRRINH